MKKSKSIVPIISNKLTIENIHDSSWWVDILNNPGLKICEAVTGAIKIGKQDLAVSAMRVVQGLFKGNIIKQLGEEIERLINEGKIDDDYIHKKYGFKSLVDVLKFIDEEDPDEDRMDFVKCVFFSVISNSIDSDEILKYQLLNISKKLKSENILILKVSFDLYKNGNWNQVFSNVSYEYWLSYVAGKIGHNIVELVELNDQLLVDLKLFLPRQGGGNMITKTNARLTNLGIKLCENWENGNNILKQDK